MWHSPRLAALFPFALAAAAAAGASPVQQLPAPVGLRGSSPPANAPTPPGAPRAALLEWAPGRLGGEAINFAHAYGPPPDVLPQKAAAPAALPHNTRVLYQLDKAAPRQTYSGTLLARRPQEDRDSPVALVQRRRRAGQRHKSPDEVRPGQFTVLLQPWSGFFHLPLWLPPDDYAVVVSGVTPTLSGDDSWWKVEFHTGGPVDTLETPFQFNVRPNKDKVVRNTFHAGIWGNEETSGGNPFGPPGNREQVAFLREGTMWAVYVNGQAFPAFNFRDRSKLPLTALSVGGLADVQVELIAHEEAKSSWCRPGEGTLLYISVFSGPRNIQRRQAVREQWLSILRADPAFQACVLAEFLIGHEVIVPVANQEQVAHELEMEQEEQAYGDIWRIPHPETYSELPDKTLLALRRGLSTGAKFILKVDDDQKLHIPLVLNHMRQWNPLDSIYGGNAMFQYPMQARQRGADGSFANYMSGRSYLLSAPLARSIAEDDGQHSVGYAVYGTDAEDLDMGHWVDYARNRAAVLVKMLPISEVLQGWQNRTHDC